MLRAHYFLLHFLLRKFFNPPLAPPSGRGNSFLFLVYTNSLAADKPAAGASLLASQILQPKACPPQVVFLAPQIF